MSDKKELNVKLINPLIFKKDEEEVKDNNEEQELIKPLIFEETKSAEEKMYLLLYYFVDEDGDESKTFEFIIGRTEVRERIINDLAIGDIDIHKSRVLVEKVPLEDNLSIYEFMKHIEMYFEDNPFDIETYNVGDYDEDDIERLNNEFTNNNNADNFDDEKEIEAQNYQEQMLGLVNNRNDDDDESSNI